MGRTRLIALLVGVAGLLALLAPSAALAGTFNWSLPGDFTTAPPGSNPEHKYGAVSWSYLGDGALMTSFSSSTWFDNSGDSIADSGSQMTLSAQPGHSVSITWTNPFPSTQTVTIEDSIRSGGLLGCTLGTVSAPSGTTTLAPGATVSVTVTAGPAFSCTASGTISISATTPGPTVTLNSPGSKPLNTATLTLSGTASTGFTASNQVNVNVYAGTDTGAKPVRQLTAMVGSGGQFGVQVAPSLADGQYTAVASQSDSTGTGFSPVVQFRIKVNPPALTMFQPPGDVWIGRSNLAFSGQAGHELGDSRTVSLYLYGGKNTTGRFIGRRDVSVQGGSWSTGWPGLSLGYYTVVAVQGDDAGHLTRTSPHTFRLVARTRAFGRVRITRSGGASIPVGCLAPSGRSCRGTVLIITKRSFRTAAGGPSGPLEVLFASVRIPGGTMGVISGRVPGRVMAVLRRLHGVKVKVTANFPNAGGRRSASRSVRIK